MPVKTYSSGMLLRLGFSIAAHLDADVLLIDEVLAVGDEGFQRKCLRRISEQIASGATVVLVSHDAGRDRARVRARGRARRRAGRVRRPDGRGAAALPPPDGDRARRRRVGAPAPASRSIEVTDVELRDELGRPGSVFRTGQSDAGARRAARQACAGPRLADARDPGADAASACSAPPPRWSWRTDGRARLAFEIPDLALLGGDYDLALGAAARGRGPEPRPDRPLLGGALGRARGDRRPPRELALAGPAESLVPAEELS